MPERSPNLDLPYLQPAQAQKHVTHNEALQQLDALVQLSVVQFDALTPPPLPEEGDRYALGENPTDAWDGQGGMLAIRAQGGWIFVPPQDGWQAWGQNESALRIFQGGSWGIPGVEQLGINTSADATNRLAVASDAVLLNHAGAGHQVKVNKAGDTDTASLLFQSNFTGHAELGLAGNNDMSFKVSPDGGAWIEALVLNQTTGLASGAAVQSSASDTTPGRLMRADYGYSPGNIVGSVGQNGGMPTGAVIESGSNANGDFTRWADGTQICRAKHTHLDVNISTAAGGAFRSSIFYEPFPAPFVAEPLVVVSGTRASDDWDVWTVVHVITLTQFSVLHMKLAADGDQDRTMSYIAIGRWF